MPSTREKAEILKVASKLFRDKVLIGVVQTGNGKDEKGSAFLIVHRDNGVALGISGKGLEIFRLSNTQIMAMFANGDLADPKALGESLIIQA